MNFRFYIVFSAITLQLLFYPGTPKFFDTFVQADSVLTNQDNSFDIRIRELPRVQSTYEPWISAEGVFVVELETFTSVFARNEHQQMYPASTTKVMTAIVAREQYDIDGILTIQNPRMEGQTMGLFEGERISVENLLYGVLIHSGNDSAYALAEDKGYRFFMEEMNLKASKLGMKNSFFENPAGFDTPLQRSSPFDLSLAARELLKDPLLRKMVGIKEITISDADYSTFHSLRNINRLLGEVRGLGGLKTGTTPLAGENLISLYVHEGKEYIIVVMKSNDRFSDTKSIVDWINDSVTYSQEIVLTQ